MLPPTRSDGSQTLAATETLSEMPSSSNSSRRKRTLKNLALQNLGRYWALKTPQSIPVNKDQNIRATNLKIGLVDNQFRPTKITEFWRKNEKAHTTAQIIDEAVSETAKAVTRSTNTKSTATNKSTTKSTTLRSSSSKNVNSRSTTPKNLISANAADRSKLSAPQKRKAVALTGSKSTKKRKTSTTDTRKSKKLSRRKYRLTIPKHHKSRSKSKSLDKKAATARTIKKPLSVSSQAKIVKTDTAIPEYQNGIHNHSTMINSSTGHLNKEKKLELFIEKLILLIFNKEKGDSALDNKKLPKLSTLKGSKHKEREILLFQNRVIWEFEYRVKRAWVDVWECNRFNPFFSDKQLAFKIGYKHGIKIHESAVRAMLEESKALDDREMNRIAQAARSEYSAASHKVLVEKQASDKDLSPSDLTVWMQRMFGCNITEREVVKLLQTNSYSFRTDGSLNETAAKEEIAEHTFVDDALFEWMLLNIDNFIWNYPIVAKQGSEMIKIGYPTKKTIYKVNEEWVDSFRSAYNFPDWSDNHFEPYVDISSLENLKPSIAQQLGRYLLSDVYSVNISGLFYRMHPEWTMCKVAYKPERYSGKLSMITSTNGDGSDRLPLWLIGNAVNPPGFDEKDQRRMGIIYSMNSVSKVKPSLFNQWLAWFDSKMEGRKVLLILHKKPTLLSASRLILKNTQLIYLPSNTNSLLEPFDNGITRNLRVLYRLSYHQHLLNNSKLDPSVTDLTFGSAAKILKSVWLKKLNSSLISCCFRDFYLGVGAPPPVELNSVQIHKNEIQMLQRLNVQIASMGYSKPMLLPKLLNFPKEADSLINHTDDDLIDIAEDDALALEDYFNSLQSNKEPTQTAELLEANSKGTGSDDDKTSVVKNSQFYESYDDPVYRLLKDYPRMVFDLKTFANRTPNYTPTPLDLAVPSSGYKPIDSKSAGLGFAESFACDITPLVPNAPLLQDELIDVEKIVNDINILNAENFSAETTPEGSMEYYASISKHDTAYEVSYSDSKESSLNSNSSPSTASTVYSNSSDKSLYESKLFDQPISNLELDVATPETKSFEFGSKSQNLQKKLSSYYSQVGYERDFPISNNNSSDTEVFTENPRRLLSIQSLQIPQLKDNLAQKLSLSAQCQDLSATFPQETVLKSKPNIEKFSSSDSLNSENQSVPISETVKT